MHSPTPNFFQTKRTLSEIKAELLPAYFRVWAETQAVEELILADLNAGNGLETDSEKAAALQILEAFQEAENASENGSKTLKLFLSDASKTNLEKLKQSLEITVNEETNLPENIHFLSEDTTPETLRKLLQKVPGLLVAEPFSYAPAQEIISETLENLTTDLLLLFDYRKLEKTFSAENPTVFIKQLFSDELPEVKATMQLQHSPKRKEQFLTEQLENGFRKLHYFPLLFKINAPGKSGNATYLLLASKTIANYFQAKEWLQTFSEFQEDGVPLFGVNLNYQPAAIPGFSDFLNKFSLENLTQELASRKADFHYQTIRQIYETHSPATHYVISNYEQAFRNLQQAGKVNLVDDSNKKVTRITPEAVVFYRLHNAQKS